jgi:hypothetical protein
MRVLVACEFSGIVRDAFIARGHDAISCDVLPSERPGPHLQCDVREVLQQGWDMMIAHPPCTHLCSSGARWWSGKQREQEEALTFVRELWAAPIARVAIENPPGALGALFRPANQYVQPWQFGHGETKATGLWLRNLPLLRPTVIVAGREPRVHRMPPSETRWMDRSRTYEGIAAAMAEQWGREDLPLQMELFDTHMPATARRWP